MNTKFDQIVTTEDIASFKTRDRIGEILHLAQQENCRESSSDTHRVLLLAIDIQNDFMQDIGSLAVQGSKKDVERLTKWMYRNLSKITQVMCSIDCHSIDQIFHGKWWVDQNGQHPQPFTIISKQDVLEKKWIPLEDRLEWSLSYLDALEQQGLKSLCIWPYHCLEGSFGAQLETEFTNMLYFHAALRNSKPLLIYKGQNPYTEMYGIIKAEFDPEEFVNQPILEAIATYDQVVIAGQASSHCVLASVEQIAEYFKDRPDVTSNITLLSDCMSAIDGFEASTTLAFEQLSKKYNITIARSTEVIL